ncbi:MAG TPA: ATP-dependent protease subunit HslV [Acidobacteriota bacterium]|nr:ATP-dependent protease subunit HslV [Acidobacteriota bacterium]
MLGIRSTTVVVVRRGDQVAMAGDGQVSFGDTVLKRSAVKIRRLRNGTVLTGFAGATADAFSLLTRFETKLDEFNGNLQRASVELAKEWRTDKVLRQLEALMLVADRKHSFLLSGDGDVVEPDDGVLAIGSGGPYATAAARALMRHTRKKAETIAREALSIAAEICVFSNSNITVEVL